MKNKTLSMALLVLLLSSNTQSLELVTNLYTKHVFSSEYKDKDSGKKIKYNEDNKMFSLWKEIDQSEFDRPFASGTQVKYGFGVFTDSFYKTGPIAGIVVEPRIKSYSIAGLGSYETYYGLGAIMTTTYESMSFLPIPISHIGIRTKTMFANVGAYAMGGAVTANIGLKF